MCTCIANCFSQFLLNNKYTQLRFICYTLKIILWVVRSSINSPMLVQVEVGEGLQQEEEGQENPSQESGALQGVLLVEEVAVVVAMVLCLVQLPVAMVVQAAEQR